MSRPHPAGRGTNGRALRRVRVGQVGRRIEFINDVNAPTRRYCYDGVNEVHEVTTVGMAVSSRACVHGVSYIDERLALYGSAKYYYVIGRMYA